MCSCFKCKKESIEAAVICEICDSGFCGSCANISATEARVITLKNRVLIFLCSECRPIINEKISLAKQIILYKKLIEDKETMISDKQKIIDILENKNKIERNKNTIKSKGINKEIPSGSKTEPETNNTKIYQDVQRKIMKSVIDLASPINKNPPTLLKEQNTSKQGKSQTSILNSKSPNLQTDKHQDNTDSQGFISESEKWQIIHRRKKSSKRNVGQSDVNNEKFTGVKPKVWLYLYKVTQNVMEDDIKHYLKTKTANNSDEFIVKDLKEPGSSGFKTFMVAADFQYKETFYEPSFWPKGVYFRRFDFNKHFEKYKTRHIINNESDNRPNSFLEVTS